MHILGAIQFLCNTFLYFSDPFCKVTRIIYIKNVIKTRKKCVYMPPTKSTGVLHAKPRKSELNWKNSRDTLTIPPRVWRIFWTGPYFNCDAVDEVSVFAKVETVQTNKPIGRRNQFRHHGNLEKKKIKRLLNCGFLSHGPYFFPADHNVGPSR